MANNKYKVCSVEGCDRPLKSAKYCRKHYDRWKKHGSPHLGAVVRYALICSIEGCSRKHHCKGYCAKHYGRFLRNETTDLLRAANGEPLAFVEKTVKQAREGNLSKTDCVIFPHAKDDKGYGTFVRGGIQVSAHRTAFILFSEVDNKDKYVLHSCDKPACINPFHLRWGTHKENMQDMTSRNRQCRGSRCHASALFDFEVVDILQDERPLRQIAASYGVSWQSIKSIKSGKKWKHIYREQVNSQN